MDAETKIEAQRLTSAVGAVIKGIDLRQTLAPDIVRALRQALLDHGVIFFHDQDLSDDEMLSFVTRFGDPLVASYDSGVARPVVIQGNLAPTKRGTAVWHADVTWIPAPPMATALRAVRLPSVGGDTCWASMEAAYNALSEPFRGMLDRLTAVHSMQPTVEREPTLGRSLNPEVTPRQSVHPVVRVHPETGRKALYVSECATLRIVELSPAESAHVLTVLFAHIRSPDFALRWHWTRNDLAFWDNRSVQHYAVPDYEGERVMQRAELAGDAPVGPH